MSRRPSDKLAELIMGLLGGAGIGIVIGAIVGIILLFVIGLLMNWDIQIKTLILMSRQPSNKLAELILGLLKGGVIGIILLPFIILIIILIMNAML